LAIRCAAGTEEAEGDVGAVHVLGVWRGDSIDDGGVCVQAGYKVRETSFWFTIERTLRPWRLAELQLEISEGHC
jgi:hypothetical protein